jgi:hypothetical protein
MVPAKYLEASIWQALSVDVLYAVYDDGEIVPGTLDAEAVYQPVGRVPAFVLCRTSDSEKRMESVLSSNVIQSGAWGDLCEVLGGGSPLGLCVCIKQGDTFCGAHALPDIIHLIACMDDLPADSAVKDVYDGKNIKVYRMGPVTDDAHPHHDLVITTKFRWFRNRNNPKFLGFSKDDRV